jgi:enoyl-CoA hydratase/carnithine racemase
VSVLVEHDGHVSRVTLNRPDKLNALNLALFEGLVEAGEQLQARPETRAVVLSGAGRSFCAGLDFPAFMAGGPAVQQKLIADRTGPANLAQRAAWIWRELDVPVIVAIVGHCFGGGMQIAMGGDVRIGHADASLSVMELRWGIIPDMAFTRTLMNTVRPDVLAELTYTAKRVSGAEGVALGLLTRLAEDPMAEAVALAQAIAARSPDAVRAAKRMMRDAPALDTAGAFRLETELQVPLLGSPNQMEAVMANMQKRPPKFTS